MNYINHYKFICKGLFKTRSNNFLDFFRSRNQNGHSILVVIRFCQQYLDDFAIQGQEIRKHFGRNGDPRSVTYQQADKAVRRKTKTKLLKLAWQVWQLIFVTSVRTRFRSKDFVRHSALVIISAYNSQFPFFRSLQSWRYLQRVCKEKIDLIWIITLMCSKLVNFYSLFKMHKE